MSGRRRINVAIDLLKYALVPSIGVLSPLLVIPAISSRFGAGGWAAMALGQAAGNGAALFVGLGWDVVGPQDVAASSGVERARLYRQSVASRLVALVPASAIAGILSLIFAPHFKTEAGLIAVATTCAAMTAQWYFIGLNRAALILLTDGIPRLGAALLSALAVWLGGPLVVFPVLTLLVMPCTLALSGWVIDGRAWPSGSDWRQSGQIIRRQSVVMWGRSLTFLFTSAPVILVGAAAPGILAQYSAGDRLARMSVMVLRSVPSRLQSWIGSARGSEQMVPRIRRGLIFQCALGLAAFVGFGLFAPTVSRLVFAGAVDVDYPMAFACGAVVGMISVGAGIGLGLVALGRADMITIGVVVGAVLAVTLVPVCARGFGATQAMTAVFMAESCCDAVQAYLLWRLLRRPPPVGRHRMVRGSQSDAFGRNAEQDA